VFRVIYGRLLLLGLLPLGLLPLELLPLARLPVVLLLPACLSDSCLTDSGLLASCLSDYALRASTPWPAASWTLASRTPASWRPQSFQRVVPMFLATASCFSSWSPGPYGVNACSRARPALAAFLLCPAFALLVPPRFVAMVCRRFALSVAKGLAKKGVLKKTGGSQKPPRMSPDEKRLVREMANDRRPPPKVRSWPNAAAAECAAEC
jgi:hypothetical protein